MQSPPPATTAEEAAGLADRPVAMDAAPPGGATLVQEEEEAAATGAEAGALVGDAWASVVPPDWVPVMRQDIHSQRRIKPQAPFSDAYLSGMPAKRRKTMQEGEGGRLSLADALRRAARGAGAQPVTSVESLARDADATQAAYRQQVKSDIKKRLKDDSDYDPSRFPNSRRVFEDDDS
ncbi:large proline-rich protein BAG6-like [Lethenteron reissneri]|uniref:large proline-rich protein BAG6-like n=1 Tax=Lethenteron reissneri TaxID=7753 RepID=UPI002AB7D212|nr:large proline-rich protein BAG6-like [Lethenteron reissneri]